MSKERGVNEVVKKGGRNGLMRLVRRKARMGKRGWYGGKGEWINERRLARRGG